MTYDDRLDAKIREYNDAPIPLWQYTYDCLNDELKVGLREVDTKEDAELAIEALQDYLLDTLYYLKDEVKETDIA